MSRDWQTHVVFSVDISESLLIRLWGGALREAGALDPSEPILPLRDEEVHWARCIATMGRARLYDLARALGAQRGFEVRQLITPPLLYRVYEYCFWKAEEWIEDVIGDVRHEKSESGELTLIYPTLDHWMNLSWLCCYSPFDFELHFFGDQGRFMSWTGIGDDNCNLQIELYGADANPHDALSHWAGKTGINLYRLDVSEDYKLKPWDITTDSPHAGLSPVVGTGGDQVNHWPADGRNDQS